MEERNYTYSEKAAKWWSNKVSGSTNNLVHGIIPFEKSLEREIRNNTSLRGSMNISTYHSHSALLEKLALNSQMYAEIPRGYEMKIVFDKVYVYNSQGNLVDSF